jgi:hypothetical protein
MTDFNEDILNKEDAKNFILGQMKDMQEALNESRFHDVWQIADWIGRECEEVMDGTEPAEM